MVLSKYDDDDDCWILFPFAVDRTLKPIILFTDVTCLSTLKMLPNVVVVVSYAEGGLLFSSRLLSPQTSTVTRVVRIQT